jgi:hypothetical protein
MAANPSGNINLRERAKILASFSRLSRLAEAKTGSRTELDIRKIPMWGTPVSVIPML